MSEHEEQKAFVQGFRMLYPKTAPYLIAIPNGGARSAVTGGKLKAEGVAPGFPDLFLALPRSRRYGLFIEMKATGNTIQACSSLQRWWLVNLTHQGYGAAPALGVDDAIGIVGEYFKGRNWVPRDHMPETWFARWLGKPRPDL